MILLPLMSISNSSLLLSTCIYQLLGKKRTPVFGDAVTSSGPCCCLLHAGRQGQLPAGAHSLHASRCSRSLCAPLGFQDWKAELFLLSCISFWQLYQSRMSRQSPGRAASACAYLSIASSLRGPGWRPSPWDTAIFWVGARGRQAHLALDM